MKKTALYQSILRLARWYQEHHRTLPFRDINNPYLIWISEIMLQQTQIKNMLPYYQRFIKNFPTMDALSKISDEEILSYWSGLGYYRRAFHILRSVQEIISKHNGIFPSSYKILLTLPGIGQYTAGAIMSFAYRQPYPILDGNIKRILCRVNQNNHTSQLWRMSAKLVKWVYLWGYDISRFNQALMDLGSLICQPKNPICVQCPLQSICLSYKWKTQDLYPLKKSILISTHQYVLLVPYAFEKGGFLYFLSKSKDDLLKFVWNFPMVRIDPKEKNIERYTMSHIRKIFSDLLFLKISKKKIHFLGLLDHSITHNKLKIFSFVLDIGKSYDTQKMTHETALKSLGYSSILKKSLFLFKRLSKIKTIETTSV